MTMMLQPSWEGGMGSYSLPVVAYCTRSDITSEGGGEPHVHNLHVDARQPQQPFTLVYKVYSCSMKLAWLSSRISSHETELQTHINTHFQPRDKSEPPMSSRLDVSHGITSTSASLQGPESQQQRKQQVF